ncbi:MAG TPA: adenylate/guanylate cyclase domain-containing protein [Xanthobacteraceae bacterium]|nr:adenylate/guanylate cyclase domain-containing protein [Xanthobacteraceae bacterium]
MTIPSLKSLEQSSRLAALRSERPLRLTTGLILFAYVTCHFLDHAFGIRSIEAMDAASAVLLAPWQTLVGLLLLYSALTIHGLLGLFALYRRRHLRMPASEAWQLALGLAIPLLLIPHAIPIRVGESFYGLQFHYSGVVYALWWFTFGSSLIRQYGLLLVVWIHGCIGLRAWLASKSWYPRASGPLASLAVLVPVLALLGFTNAGLDAREAGQRDPAAADAHLVAAPGTPAAAHLEAVHAVADALAYIYLGLVAGTVGLRALRNWHVRRFRAVRITYPGDRVVTVPTGFTVLEASRWARIPHTSVCGGRGRCSTCRIRVTHGGAQLAPPNPTELRTLARIGDPPGVRLACQLRPQADIVVEPLVRSTADAARDVMRFGAAIDGGAEMEIAALFVDLRESTRLAAGRLPYDALFLFDRYIQAVTAAVRQHAGFVTSIAGDGIMSMFAIKADIAEAARNAFLAAADIWDGVDRLNRELAEELPVPLRIGIGLHVGTAVVGVVPSDASGALQFLGDTGNVAAKLEDATSRLKCVLIASAQASATAAPARRDNLATVGLAIAGKDAPLRVCVFRTRADIDDLLRPATTA